MRLADGLLLSLGLECHSVICTNSVTSCRYTVPPHFLLDASQGSGALSLARRFLSAPVGGPPRPACGVHLYSPLALGLSHFWEPRVSTLAFQKPLAAIALPEPPFLTARGTRVRLRAPRHPNTPHLRVFADSPRTRWGMSSGVISQASPILPNPLCFYFNPTHYS